MEIKRHHHINFWYIIVAFLAVIMIQDLFSRPNQTKTIPYSEFEQLLDQGKVTNVVVGPNEITGTYREAGTGAPKGQAGPPAARPTTGQAPAQKEQEQRFLTYRITPDLADKLLAAKVVFSGQPPPGIFQNILAWLLPSLGFLLLWIFVIRRMSMGGSGMGGLTAIGKSRAKVFVEKGIKTSFADVAGLDEAKAELKELVSFLKDPQSYGRLGAHVPKGVLLVGPPGTGKTLLARAVAGEADVPFFSISGAEFVEMFVGVGAARVRDLFEQARQKAPAIIFIDELDALGRARGSFLPGGGHDEVGQTLDQLLTELDGFDVTTGVVLIAATNRPKVLDPALLRAGRFDRQILVDRPDKKDRVEILRVHLKKIKLDANVSVDEIAALTPGFTGADLANLVNEAAVIATRRSARNVALEDFNQAVERMVAGLEKRNRLLNPHERNVVAHHEMGHALVAMSLKGVDPVHKVSIIPHGIRSLGYTLQRPLEDRFLLHRFELMNRMAVLLGGRASEHLFFDQVSTGAADDLVKATEIARSMVVRGMDDKLGQVVYETEPAPLLGVPAGGGWYRRRYGEATAGAIDGAVKLLINSAYQKALGILAANRTLVDEAAKALVAQETLSDSELQKFAARLERVEPTSPKRPEPVGPCM